MKVRFQVTERTVITCLPRTVQETGGESEVISFELDTEETPVIMTVNMEAFSPNGDGKKDVIKLNPVLNVTQGIKKYRIEIKDQQDKPVKVISGQGRLKSEYSWDGFTDSGEKAPDGTYKADLTVEYEKGDVSRAASRTFQIDTLFPQINLSVDYTLFSPDGDGKKDSINLKQSTSSEDLVTGIIRDSRGEAVREFLWQGTAGNLDWDGTDSKGNKVPDGEYSYVVFIEDKAGNRTERTIDSIKIDNRGASVFVTADLGGFTPDNDGINDRIEFTTIATLKDGIKSWKFNIMQNGNTLIKSFEGETLPEKIIWDGRNEEGKVIEGDFTGEYSVLYHKGNEPVSVTKKFRIDISAPEAALTMTPFPFSPDNDGVDDELTIKIDVRDMSDIDLWSLDIADREGNAFKSFGGRGQPTGKIIWDGIGSSGELVIAAEDYPYRLKVTDVYGNETNHYGYIPVDVLVVKEGDKLKIRIANITFAPDSAELKKDDPEIKQKNEYVLGRLAEILKKYESYKIVIEGHAVSVFWADKARAEREEIEELKPLSKQRAETVKNYLKQLGIVESRMTTEGLGGTRPIVPHGDLDNRWKNRRVEFILVK